MNPKKSKKIDIGKLFDEEETEFFESLNEKIKEGMSAKNMLVQESTEVETKHGQALRIILIDQDTQTMYSFLCSGKIFRKLFEDNVEPGDKINIYLNEKSHWRFDFSK